jgi:hypothetical protein
MSLDTCPVCPVTFGTIVPFIPFVPLQLSGAKIQPPVALRGWGSGMSGNRGNATRSGVSARKPTLWDEWPRARRVDARPEYDGIRRGDLDQANRLAPSLRSRKYCAGEVASIGLTRQPWQTHHAKSP